MELRLYHTVEMIFLRYLFTGSTNFPFRKSVSDYDITVEPSTGDNGYLQQVEKQLQLCLEFEPDLVLYQAGIDGLETDSLGKLSVSRNGMMRRNEMVFNSIFEAQKAYLL